MSIFRHTPEDERHFVVRSARAALPYGGAIPFHRHRWHQLIYAERGAVTVETDTGVWAIPTGWAVWAAANTAHAIRFHAGCAYTALYIRPNRSTNQPSRALSVSPLLASLIARIGEIAFLDRRNAVHRAMAQLTIAELPDNSPPQLTLPLPQSPALRTLAAAILDGTAPRQDAVSLAGTIGLSVRTLERRFAEETGMSFGSWRRHARLLAALRMCSEGMPVAAAAAATGYRSPSALIAAFRGVFGVTPGQKLARLTQTRP